MLAFVADFTCDILVVVAGSSGRLNFFCDPMAAGKEGAENMAATELMTLIQDSISSGLLRRKEMTVSTCYMVKKPALTVKWIKIYLLENHRVIIFPIVLHYWQSHYMEYIKTFQATLTQKKKKKRSILDHWHCGERAGMFSLCAHYGAAVLYYCHRVNSTN